MTTTITSCPLTHHNYVHHYVITELYTVHYKYKPTEPRGLSLLNGRAKKFKIFKNGWTIRTTNEPNLQLDHSPFSPCYSHISLSFSCDFFVTIILPTTCTCFLSPLSFFILTIQHQLPTPKTPPDEDLKVENRRG